MIPASAPAPIAAAASPNIDIRAFAETRVRPRGSTLGRQAPLSTAYALDSTSAPNAAG